LRQQTNLLKRLGASQELVDSFVDVCNINSLLPEDQRSDFATLLEEQCRKFGFRDVLPDGWFFRPYALGGNSFRKDTAVTGEEPEAPAIEQAYRRGVAQGFANCRRLVQQDKNLREIKKEIEKEEQKIDSWRRRAVQSFSSLPGSDEPPPKRLFGGRDSISNRMRWAIFCRDKFRCVKCGQGAADNITIEVDHIVAVAKGGFDTIDNLQTLCGRCNSGKSDS
jgi:hypothetical protein